MELIAIWLLKLVAIVFSEILVIVFSVGVFILFIQTKVRCPYCQAEFYYQSDRKDCPECHGNLIFDDPDDDESNQGDLVELETHICYKCGAEFSCQINVCPQCGCQLDDQINEKTN